MALTEDFNTRARQAMANACGSSAGGSSGGTYVVGGYVDRSIVAQPGYGGITTVWTDHTVPYQQNVLGTAVPNQNGYYYIDPTYTDKMIENFKMSYQGVKVMGKNNMNYDTPIMECEKDCKKFLQYELIGLGFENITDEVEFVNKTETTYLTIKGTYEDEDTDFTNEINIRIPIDTKVYCAYDLRMNNGLLTVVLYEIVKDRPQFERVVELREKKK
jgi:hypothetical protein